MTLFTFTKGDDEIKTVEEAIKKERAIYKYLEDLAKLIFGNSKSV